MRVIMTGGGTGGHIYPAIAIADEIKKRDPDAKILFVGAERGLEKTLVPKRGYDIRLITVEGFDRKHLARNVRVVRKLMKGNKQAAEIIRDFRPDFVVGTGGYASGPMVKAAQKAKIPTFVHEQNAYPGVTNKLLEKGAKAVFLGFARAAEYFKEQDKLVVSGNPVRDEFRDKDRDEARRVLGFDDDRFVVLAFGGSQGAGRINKAMTNVIKDLNGRDDISIVLGAGSYYYDAILKSFREEGFEPADNIRIIEYIDDMASYLAAADLVISRSGALTVAETTVSGRPAIFIPSPMVTGNHQYYNALAVAEAGGAIIIEEKDLEDDKLTEEILRLKVDPQVLDRMAQASRRCGPDRATEIICDKILEEVKID
ncbi:MAG: undecaprenyldiphospho-muramoylpentapeptide beta-N-acetylglucosaminyltransferase [Clostridia bacterium]|nr:undecaprenyldiphospho-muramoylpentapeptide beta-N-acetylglucosaminyltransferase [Clostridia bacterium]